MNNLRQFIKKHSVLISFILVFLGFIYLKVTDLQNYFFYDGKVIDIYRITSKHSSVGKGRGGTVYISREIPKIEYYVKHDTLQSDQGELKMVTNFEINEKITVLVDKEDHFKTKIFSLFYYWIEYNELIIFLFSYIFILGFIKTFL